MKLITILLCLFIGCTSWGRGPVDPITPPWPLRALPVNKVELPGRWIGFLYHTIWVVEIDSNIDEDGVSEIQIKSNTDLIPSAKGWLNERKNVFVGQVVDGGKTFNIMIFRDEQGTKLRVADTHGYFDLKLLKGE